MITGVKVTLLLVIVTTITSLLFGTLLTVMRVSRLKALRIPGTIHVEFCRNIPGLVWILFFYFVFPELLPSNWGMVLHRYTYYSIVAAILGLTIDNSSFVSDILKSGRLAIPESQREAAITLGFNTVQQWLYVMLPQMYRAVLPPLGTRMIHNFLNTSLAMAITAPDLTWATLQIESITFKGLEATTIATGFYVAMSGIMVMIVLGLEKLLKINMTSITSSKV